MSRFPSGWRTTMEPDELGYPVRYWWTEDNWSDVAWCEQQGSAATACSALAAARAQPDPDPDAELEALRAERAAIDGDELRALQQAAARRHAALAKELGDDSVDPYATLCRIATLLELPWPNADARATSAASVSAELLRAAAAELISGLLDETMPLGEMHRHVDSARQTVSERAIGIREHVPPAAAATNAAARELVDLLVRPYERQRRRRPDEPHEPDRYADCPRCGRPVQPGSDYCATCEAE